MDRIEKTRLSNQAVATLSQYARKVRASLGAIKVSDLVKDHRYAFNCFVQTALSEQEDIVTLTLKANNEMNIEKHLINALYTYFRQFKLKAKDHAVIQRNQSFLIKLATSLHGVSVDGDSYRQAVDQFLFNVDSNEKQLCIDLARNFYSYWVNANGTLLEGSAEQSAEDAYQEGSIIALWNSVDEVQLSSVEKEKLNHYKAVIEHKGLLDKEVEVRVKIAKVILVELQKNNPTAEGYRANVDAIQKRFSSVRLRDYVLAVSREFYHFCADTQPSK